MLAEFESVQDAFVKRLGMYPEWVEVTTRGLQRLTAECERASLTACKSSGGPLLFGVPLRVVARGRLEPRRESCNMIAATVAVTPGVAPR